MEDNEIQKIEIEYDESFTKEDNERLYEKLRKRQLERVLAKSNKNGKKVRINLRLEENDIELLKVRAKENGLPYQTLISVILSKYAKGNIKIEL